MLQHPAPLARHAAEHGSDARQRNAKRSFAGRIPKRSLGTTEDEVFARHRGIIAQGSGLRAASGEDGTPPCGGAGEGVSSGLKRMEDGFAQSRADISELRREIKFMNRIGIGLPAGIFILAAKLVIGI